MKFLLENTLMDLLTLDGVLTGIILAAVGLSLSLLAKRITRVVRNKSEIEINDHVLISLKAFGLVCILIALVLVVLSLN
jgi:hypothetical protein